MRKGKKMRNEEENDNPPKAVPPLHQVKADYIPKAIHPVPQCMRL